VNIIKFFGDFPGEISCKVHFKGIKERQVVIYISCI